MTNSGAKSVIVISLTGSAGVVAIAHIAKGEAPPPKQLIGGAFAFVLLGFMADFAPEPAALFALLIFATTLLVDGSKAFKVFGG